MQISFNNHLDNLPVVSRFCISVYEVEDTSIWYKDNFDTSNCKIELI